MSCSYGVISRSDPRFSNLPSSPPLPTATSARFSTPDPFLRPSRVTVPSRLRSFAVRAAINDGYVAAPPLVETLSFYELLGISEKGTLGEIKQAYKQLARKYHPDVSPPDRVEEYTQRFIRVQEAYETLSDPRRRAMYDRDMAGGIHLALSARRRYQVDEAMEEPSDWKSRWQSQLSELKRRSMTQRDGGENMSWGARMRRQRDDLSSSSES